jgi:hypothetical protein
MVAIGAVHGNPTFEQRQSKRRRTARDRHRKAGEDGKSETCLAEFPELPIQPSGEGPAGIKAGSNPADES